jgi:hypothetical protein
VFEVGREVAARPVAERLSRSARGGLGREVARDVRRVLRRDVDGRVHRGDGLVVRGERVGAVDRGVTDVELHLVHATREDRRDEQDGREPHSAPSTTP